MQVMPNEITGTQGESALPFNCSVCWEEPGMPLIRQLFLNSLLYYALHAFVCVQKGVSMHRKHLLSPQLVPTHISHSSYVIVRCSEFSSPRIFSWDISLSENSSGWHCTMAVCAQSKPRDHPVPLSCSGKASKLGCLACTLSREIWEKWLQPHQVSPLI